MKPSDKPTIAIPVVPQPPKMRAPLKEAVSLIVHKGLTQRDTAKRVGMNETSLGRALAKPHIAAWVEYQKTLFAIDMAQLKDRAKAIAINVGIDLLNNATSEQVKARMVELFTSEPKPGSAVNVQVNVDRGGYEFIPKGSRLVDITPHTDAPSGEDDGQEADIVDE